MESKLDTIIFQNWILIGLWAFLLLSSISANYPAIRKNLSKKDISLKELWETDQMERILDITNIILDKAPLNEDALYFRGRALWKTGKLEAAMLCFKRLKTTNPSFVETLNKLIAHLEKEMASNTGSKASTHTLTVVTNNPEDMSTE